MYRLPNILRTFGFLALALMWIPFCLMLASLPAGQVDFTDPETIVRSIFFSGALFSGFGLLTIAIFLASVALWVAASALSYWMRQRAKSNGESATARVISLYISTGTAVYKTFKFDLEVDHAGETVKTKLVARLHRDRGMYYRTAKTVKVKFDPLTKVAILDE